MFKAITQISVILLLCIAAAASAADTADTDAEYKLGEVVVTASGNQGVENVGTLHEITAREIEIRHATTLDKALELLPGVDIRRGAQGIPRVDMRGMRSRQVILLLNGIPFNSTYDGQFDPSLISTENIARIKVSYGNHSVLYGQGGLGGVINIITKKGTQGISGGLSADIDERGNYTARADVSGGNEKLDYFVSGSRQDADGFQVSRDFDSTSEEDGGMRENSDYLRNNLFANLGMAAGDDFRFGIVAGASQGEFGQPPSAINDSKDVYAKKVKYERVDDYDGQFAQLSMGYDPAGMFSLRAWGYVNDSDQDQAGYDSSDYSAITKKGSYDKTDETEVYGGTVQAFFNSGSKGRLGLSLNAEKNTYDSDGYEIGKNGAEDIDISHDMTLWAAALEYEITLFDRLGLAAGYSHHWQNKDEGDDDDKGAWLIGLTYDLFEHTRLRTSYARKIRFASIKNLYDASGGNEDLTTETSDNYEIGISHLLPWGIMADLALFYNDVQDYIQKNDTTDIYENKDEYRFKGLELLLSKQFSNAGLTLGYSYMDAVDRSEGTTVDDLEYRPVHKFTLEGDYEFDFGLTAYASLLHLTDQVYYGTDGSKGELGDITLVNMKLEQFVYKKTGSIYLGVDNLFDEDYEESYGFPQAGRTAYAGMKIRF